MSTNTDALQQIIINTISDRNDLLAVNVPVIWDSYTDIGIYAPRLQYLYTYRDAIALMQGYVRNSVDFRASGDLQVTLSQRFDHLQTMYDNTVKLIDNYFQQPQLFSAAFDQLVQNQPSYPPSEKEARQLRGDPYFGRRTS